MFTDKFVKDRVNKRLDSKTDINNEIMQSLRNGDQFRNFVFGLTNQMRKASKQVAIKRGKALKLSTILTTIDDFTDMYIKSFLHDQMLRNESDLDRQQREKKIQDQKDLESTIEGKSSGVYEELGVEFENDRETIQEEIDKEES